VVSKRLKREEDLRTVRGRLAVGSPSMWGSVLRPPLLQVRAFHHVFDDEDRPTAGVQTPIEVGDPWDGFVTAHEIFSDALLEATEVGAYETEFQVDDTAARTADPARFDT
jgi:hypothetical protein